MKYVSLLLLVLFFSGCQTVPSSDSDGRTGSLGRESNSPANTNISLAGEYLRRGNYKSALIKAKKAVAQDPGNSNAHLILALVYERLGENALANAAYRKALSVDRNNAYALNAYGAYLCKLDEYRKSFRYFERAVNNPLYPTPWIALTNAGVCALGIDDEKKAEQYFSRALKEKPTHPQALLNMAELAYKQGKYLSARAFIQRYREVASPVPKLLYISILTERQLGNKDQVSSDELLLFSQFPESDEARKLGK